MKCLNLSNTFVINFIASLFTPTDSSTMPPTLGSCLSQHVSKSDIACAHSSSVFPLNQKSIFSTIMLSLLSTLFWIRDCVWIFFCRFHSFQLFVILKIFILSIVNPLLLFALLLICLFYYFCLFQSSRLMHLTT